MCRISANLAYGAWYGGHISEKVHGESGRVVLATARSFTEGAHVMQYMKQATPYYCAAEQKTLPLTASVRGNGTSRSCPLHKISGQCLFHILRVQEPKVLPGRMARVPVFFQLCPLAHHESTTNYPEISSILSKRSILLVLFMETYSGSRL